MVRFTNHNKTSVNQINVFIGYILHFAFRKFEFWVVFCSKWYSAQSGVLHNLGGVLLKVVFCSESGVLMNILIRKAHLTTHIPIANTYK